MPVSTVLKAAPARLPTSAAGKTNRGTSNAARPGPSAEAENEEPAEQLNCIGFYRPMVSCRRATLTSSESRDASFKNLDRELTKRFISPEDRVLAHLLPYCLRAKALDEKLPSHAFGRAIYHLAQRRGFLSNRKAVTSEDTEKEEGVVKTKIHELRQKMEESGSRTLGEYFCTLDPEAEKSRIRERWTARDMYAEEFEKIWTAQAKFHKKTMTDELKEAVHHAIFFQRPLKSQKDKIGKCEVFPEKHLRRAPKASLEFQTFRCWQKILDLEYWQEDGVPQHLTRDQQDALAKMLETAKDISFAQVKKLLGFKANVKVSFNLEAGGNTKIPGNSTYARLSKIIPDRWAEMSAEERASLISEILQFEREDALAKRLMKVFDFSVTEAEALAAVPLESGYGNFSKYAMKRILEKMLETRQRLNAVLDQYFEVKKANTDPTDFLPPLEKVIGAVRNPVVTRSLTEVRKVVNAIIRRYGKPEFIRIEMARDMKKSRKQREADSADMRRREKKRDDAKTRIIKGMGIKEPKGGDILKVLLAEECNWTCPFTGKSITMRNLLGVSPEFDIEHILPFSRSLDNSFINKTLCHVHENRHVKKGRTPYEAYLADEQKYHEILTRVKNFQSEGKSKFPNPKLRRFMMDSIPEDFSSRMLNDTRYICRLATDYLGTLFGGQIEISDEDADAQGTRRIHVCTGTATAWLRDEWDLNAILNDGGDEKTRTDHRHHAVDAVAIAFCTPGIVHYFAKSAELAEQRDKRRRFVKDTIPTPRKDFFKIVNAAIQRIHVSYRSSHKVSGALHEETNYSKPHSVCDEKTGKPTEARYIRKPLENMSEGEIASIVDPTVRQLVQDKLAAFGLPFAKGIKLFADPQNLPYRMVPAPDGSVRYVPIRKARIRKTLSVREIGKNASTRYIATGGNHHMEVVAHLDKNGNETKWEGIIVTLFEAYQRRKNKQPVIQRDHGPDCRFKFSLTKNEFLLFDPGDGTTLQGILKTPDEIRQECIQQAFRDGVLILKRIFKMSQNNKGMTNIGWGDHTDARPANEVCDRTPGNIKQLNPILGKVQKVTVDYLGNIHPANN